MKRRIWQISRLFLLAGFCCQTASIVARYVEAGYTPVTNRFEASSYFSWLLVGLYLVIQIRQAMPVLGAFVTPLALVLSLTASVLPKKVLPLHPMLDSPWLPIHIWFAFLGDALLGLAACFALMYLIQERQLKSKRIGPFYYRLPSLDVLDRYSYRCIRIGFPLLTLGILTGSLWLKNVQGAYINWQDGKQTATLLTWFLYAALLHGRLVTGWRGRRVAVLNLVGFLVMLITFFALSHFMK
jgi:cytochrome c-type biogenesis protein CcsB